MKYIPYSRQFIDNKDNKVVLSALSEDLITTGPFVKKFENELKNISNVNLLLFAVVALQQLSGLLSLNLKMMLF